MLVQFDYREELHKTKNRTKRFEKQLNRLLCSTIQNKFWFSHTCICMYICLHRFINGYRVIGITACYTLNRKYCICHKVCNTQKTLYTYIYNLYTYIHNQRDNCYVLEISLWKFCTRSFHPKKLLVCQNRRYRFLLKNSFCFKNYLHEI